MAINWGLLSQGLTGPTPYQQDQAIAQQRQAQQQKLAAGQAELDQIKASAMQAKTFANKMREAGSDPSNWYKIYEALNSTGSPENVMNADKMLRAHYADYQLGEITRSKFPKPINEWVKTVQPSVNAAMSSSPPAANVNALADQPGTIPAADVNKLATQTADGQKVLPKVPVDDKHILSDEEQIVALSTVDNPGAQKLAGIMAQRNKPSEIAQLENEIDTLKKKFGATENDPEVVSRRRLIDSKVYGTDKDYAGFMVAKNDGSFTGDFMAYKKAIANQGKQPVAPPAPPAVTPVTIVDPKDPNKTLVVDARTNRPIGQGIKEPSGVQLSAKEVQEREAKYPDATLKLKAFDAKNAELVKDLNDLLTHKGLSGITGILFGRTPAISADARAAKALFDKIMARGTFAELQAMRDASPTGGALGNVSNQDLTTLRSAVGSLDPTQDTEDFQQSLRSVISSAKSAQSRVKEAYDLTYEYRDKNKAPAAMSSEDKAALDWANKNPMDPRAAQIKERLGAK